MRFDPLAFRKAPDGEMEPTGPLRRLAGVLDIVPLIGFQSYLYLRYRNLARWRGKAVSNTMAPPDLSGAQWRTVRNIVWSRISGVFRPMAINFAVTYACPAACPHCSAGGYRRADGRELSTAEAKRVIDEALALGVSIVGFTGGEPLVRRDIFDLIAHVDKRKAVTFLFTNGLLLDDEAIRKLSAAGLYCAYLSIDHPDPAEHDRGRGIPGLFARNAAAVAKLKANDILVAAASFATRTGTARGDYRGVHAAARALGMYNLLLLDYIPTGRALRETEEMLTPEQREEIYEFSHAVFRERGVPPVSAQAWQNSLQGYRAGIGCFAGNREMYISAYGDVTPCDFTPLSFGSVRREPLARIWRKMRGHPSYSRRTMACKMQNPLFRKTFIDAIPAGAELPFPIETLPRVDFRAAAGRPEPRI
jgi:MoaA/NifB/PqqE/SkfB family radical SAM enzyme